MVGESSKRPHSRRSPEYRNLRKIDRFDQGSASAANSNIERVAASYPSSRRSFNGPDQVGYGTPRSRSPQSVNDSPLLNMESLPKALSSFVLAVLKRDQTSQHLSNVQSDYDDMQPRCADFPALRMQKAHRLEAAKRDYEAMEQETTGAMKLLLNTLQKYFPEKVGPASHQDCVSRAEFGSLKDQLSEIRAENHDMKRRLSKLDDRLDREERLHDKSIDRIKRVEDRMTKNDDVNKTIGKTTQSTVESLKSLQEQSTKDRSSFRTRCSTLEELTSKNKHHAVDTTRSALEPLDAKIALKLQQHSEWIATAQKALRDLESNVISLAASSTPNAQTIVSTPDTHIVSQLAEFREKLDKTSSDVKTMVDENETKDELVSEEMNQLKSSVEELKNNVGKGIKDLDAWKEVQYDIKQLKSDMNDTHSSTKRDMEGLTTSMKRRMEEVVSKLEEVSSSIKSELETSINTFRQETSQGIPDTLKTHIDYTSQMVDTHTDLIQRHEVRLNSVTTDELVSMMEHQWRSRYGPPDQLKGLSTRLNKLEPYCQGVHKNLDFVKTRVDRLAADVESLVRKTMG